MHEPIDRAPHAHAGVVAPDHGDAMGHGVGFDEVLGAFQPPVERGPEALSHHVLRGIEPGRELRDRPLVDGHEQAFLRTEVQEDRPLGDPHLRGDVLDAPTAVPVLGEVDHGGLDDAFAAFVGVQRPAGSTLGHDGTLTENRHRPGTGQRKNPRDLPARREPKLPATVGLSGSGAPSNLRAVTAGTDALAAARPKALQPPRHLVVGLSTFLRGSGLPVQVHLAAFPENSIPSTKYAPHPAGL